MTTALFLLRCVEIGISIADLDLLTIGMVMDIWTEKGNDSTTYDSVATQEDFDKFFVNYNDSVLTSAELLHIIKAETEVYAHGCNNKFEYPHG
jgi:hypothetical protein